MPTSIDDILARGQTRLQPILRDRSTNSRTGQLRPVRVTDARREKEIEGLPRFILLRRWKLTFPKGDAVRPGDVETTAHGTYIVQDLASPRTLEIDTTAYCIWLGIPGSATPPFPTTDVVDFRNPDDEEWIHNVPVFIYQAAHDIELVPAAEAYDQAVVIWGDLTFPSTRKLREGHEIAWVGLGKQTNGQARRMPIAKPRAIPGLPFRVAYFKNPA